MSGIESYHFEAHAVGSGEDKLMKPGLEMSKQQIEKDIHVGITAPLLEFI